MAAQRKSTQERLDALRKEQDALKARLQALEIRKKAEERKRETRRTFVVGAAVLARAEADQSFREALQRALEASVIRDTDRAVIADLLGLQAPSPQSSEPPTGTAAA